MSEQEKVFVVGSSIEPKGFVATDAQIAEWKAKHKNGVFMVEVEGYNAYLFSPGRNELSYASVTAGKDPMKFNAAILSKCWLAGDEIIKTDDRLFMGVSSKLDELIQTAEASIKKL